jgi:hypothetical protein
MKSNSYSPLEDDNDTGDGSRAGLAAAGVATAVTSPSTSASTSHGMCLDS